MDAEKYKTKQKYIYKYCAINVFSIRNLINNELRFSPPIFFNDPLDCKFRLDVNPPIEGVKNFYRSLNKLTTTEINKKIAIFKVNPDIVKQDIEDNYNENLRNQYGVLCFSEIENNALMWSHYADSHKGMCLIFDWKEHESFFQGYKIRYNQSLPIVSYDGNGRFEIDEIVLTKLDIWSYENEVRTVIKLEDEQRNARYNPKALAGIIFGERTPEEDIKLIRRIVKLHDGFKNISFYKAWTDYKDLKIKYDKI